MGGGRDKQREKERRRRERRKRWKGKGEDERGKEKGEDSHDVLEAATFSSWAHQGKSSGDHCKEVETVRSVQCTQMVKCLQ